MRTTCKQLNPNGQSFLKHYPQIAPALPTNRVVHYRELLRGWSVTSKPWRRPSERCRAPTIGSGNVIRHNLRLELGLLTLLLSTNQVAAFGQPAHAAPRNGRMHEEVIVPPHSRGEEAVSQPSTEEEGSEQSANAAAGANGPTQESQEDDRSGSSGSSGPPTADRDAALLDELRARFVFGAVLGKESALLNRTTAPNPINTAQFSETSPYLALEFQPRWELRRAGSGSTGSKSPGSVISGFLFTWQDLILEMPIDLALTSIPVLAPASTTASTSPDEAREDQSQEMPPSSSQASGNGESGRANDTSFIQSQKTVNARATLLWELARYSSKSAGDFYWSLSAMGSGGFQSVTDEQRALRVWNLEDDLYDHWTLGARLTLYQKRDKDWFPAAYMMYGRGSFQNFEYPLEDEDSEVINCLSDPVMCHSPPPKKAFR